MSLLLQKKTEKSEQRFNQFDAIFIRRFTDQINSRELEERENYRLLGGNHGDDD